MKSRHPLSTGEELVTAVWLARANAPCHAARRGLGAGAVRFPKLTVIALAVSLPLAACSSGDWKNLTSFGETSNDDEEAAPQTASAAPRPVAQAVPQALPQSGAQPATDPWCTQVMGSDVAQAQRSGLDQATQQRMAVTSYRQCLAFFAGANPR